MPMNKKISPKTNDWPIKAINLSKELHSQLSITDKDWHALKGVSERRAAELLAGALTQLLQGGKPSEVSAMVEQVILWLNQEIKDPGCPHRQKK